MAIQNRRGVYASLDKSKLVPGEIAVCTDNGKMFYCYSAGNVVEVTTAERLQEILEASSEAYTALQELIASLDGEGSTGAQILANIATLQNNYNSLSRKIINSGTGYPTTTYANEIYYKIQ